MIWRPWGKLEQTLRFLPDCNWYYFGCISTEERSIGTSNYVRELLKPSKEKWIVINDVESRFSGKTREILGARRSEFAIMGGNSHHIEQYELFAPLSEISGISNEIVKSDVNSVFLDLTSLPKRFFFPMVRNLMASDSIQNLVCIYTTPGSYSDEDLAINYGDWDSLPGFGKNTNDEKYNLLVSVGFMAESLANYLQGHHQEHEWVKLLIPFPSPPEATRRTWEAIMKIEEAGENLDFEKIRVDTLDVSSAYDRLCSIAKDSARPIAFAPFGPKPISLAMCLYAINHADPVYYPQPESYSPDYTSGIRFDDPQRAINAYIVKLNGVNLYSV